MKSKSGDVKCIMCEEVVQTFLQYKCHLFLHYEEVKIYFTNLSLMIVNFAFFLIVYCQRMGLEVRER